MADLEYQKVYDEKYLLENLELCHNVEIMENAIMNNPKLIRLVKWDCYLNDELIKRALEKYKITKEDLELNPDLCRNFKIMQYLPEFRLYSAFLTEQEKIDEIVKCLKEGNKISVETLPFLDSKFGAKVDINKLLELLSLIDIDIDENNLDLQISSFEILDKIIDGVIYIRYYKDRFTSKYSSVVDLNDAMEKVFKIVKLTNDESKLDEFVNELVLFCGTKLMSFDYLKKTIKSYYLGFLKFGYVGLNLTNDFFVQLLNLHMNKFFSDEKAAILVYLGSKMPLSKKKINSILNGKKLKKGTSFIKNKNFEKLNITSFQYNEFIDNLRVQLLNNKNIKKSGLVVNDSIINIFIGFFNYFGYLDSTLVCNILGIDDGDFRKKKIDKNKEKAIETILSLFQRTKIKIVEGVELKNEEYYISDDERLKVGKINPSSYLIINNNMIYENIAKLIVNLNDERLAKILNNKEYLEEILFLFPYVSLLPEFDINSFINILSCYERLRRKSFTNDFTMKEINLMKIGTLINKANAYNSVDDITLSALGKTVYSSIKMERITDYFNFYLKMINRKEGSIPSVLFKMDDYKFESGLYSDPERLLIGIKSRYNSCIDLYESGSFTYQEVLCQSSGDVILIRDAKNELVSKILLFRRGNVVQMVTSKLEKFSIEIYNEIADRIMRSAIMNNDNIDYVFVNSDSCEHADCKVVNDDRFVAFFPHADFANSAILLTSKAMVLGIEEETLNLDFDAKVAFSYLKARKEVSHCPDEYELTRLRALSIILEKDKLVKEFKARDFHPFLLDKYQCAICGEDWYVALSNSGELEECILPVADERSYVEFNQAKNEILLMIGDKKTVGKR